LNFLGVYNILGLSGRHPIEKVGERWCGGRKSVFGPHVEKNQLFFICFKMSVAVSLVDEETTTKVSSTLNRDTKQFGKKFLFDGLDETCWNSDQVRRVRVWVRDGVEARRERTSKTNASWIWVTILITDISHPSTPRHCARTRTHDRARTTQHAASAHARTYAHDVQPHTTHALQGTPQFIILDFKKGVVPTELVIMFQGGFVGTNCSIYITPPDGGERTKLCEVYPEDVYAPLLSPSPVLLLLRTSLFLGDAYICVAG
jgi:hypothetical protein